MLLGAISHLLILLVSCQISSTSWRIFHKLNLLLQVTGIVQIAPIVSIISRASFHHLLLQLSISPAIDDLRWLTTFSVTQKQNWVPIDGNGSWKSLIWGFLVSASVPHNKVFFFFPWYTIINEENCKSCFCLQRNIKNWVYKLKVSFTKIELLAQFKLSYGW